ncbi:MAG: hypothetical protein ACYDCI_03800 [Candidatus Limnocylindrales bacterium]
MDDDATRIRIRLRLARFRLDGASFHGPEWEAASEQVESIERELAAIERASAAPTDAAPSRPPVVRGDTRRTRSRRSSEI